MTEPCFGDRWRPVARLLKLFATSLGLLAGLLTAGIASAQEQDPDAPAEREEDPPILWIEAADLANAWLEVTALDDVEAPPVVFMLEDRRAADGDLELELEIKDRKLVAGRFMLCTRAEALAVNCEVVMIAGPGWIETSWASGWRISGRYFLDDLPAAGVRVALVPLGLDSLRSYLMPLGPGADARGGLVREVESDADGVFITPAIAPGEYFLEALMPSGRVHRTQPFILPVLDPERLAELEASAGPPVWQVGDLEVADQLSVEVRVFDELDQPLVGAMVGGTQGEEPRQLISFQAMTDGEGVARMSGFSAEQPARLTCQARGHRRVELRFDVIPALVECELETLARVSGELVTVDGQVPVGGVVSITPREDVERAARAISGRSTRTLPMSEDDGRFTFVDLAAGSYRLALAASGYAVEQRDLTLEPGEHLELGTLVLLAGRELLGRVIDAASREPLEGVTVEAAMPPGAAFTITDADGEFRVSTALDEAWILRFSHPDYAPRSVTIDPERDDDEPLEVELDVGGFIYVRIFVEGTDLPCEGCRVVIEPGGEELYTGSLGGIRSSPLAEGYYRVYRPRAEHLGSLVIEQLDAEMRHVKVEAGRASLVTFGQRGESARVRFAPSPGSGWTLSARSGALYERYYPQADGEFEVRRPDRPLVLELFLHHFDPASQTELEVWQGSLLPDARELTLELPRTLVEGRAVTATGPLAGQEVELRTFDAGRLAARTRTASDGGFRLPHVAPGIYALRIGDRIIKHLSLRRSERLNLRTFELLPGGF